MDPEIVIPLYLSSDDDLEGDIVAARQALACELIQDLYHAGRDPLRAGRFVDNLLAAPHLTSLRVPPAPSKAVDELCD